MNALRICLGTFKEQIGSDLISCVFAHKKISSIIANTFIGWKLFLMKKSLLNFLDKDQQYVQLTYQYKIIVSILYDFSIPVV
jgi:hypothetical protein